jgi:hypothetical protein
MRKEDEMKLAATKITHYENSIEISETVHWWRSG